MRNSLVVPLLGATLAAAAAVDARAACNDVQVFILRGHGESMPGVQTSVVNAICKGRASCGYQSVAYDAQGNQTPNVCEAEYQGVLLAKKDITTYATNCPNSKLVVTGWSQGGATASDIIAGGGIPLTQFGCQQTATPPLSPTEFPGNKIAAVVTFGNFHHNANQPWNAGSCTNKDGLYPRTAAMLQALGAWKDRYRDYCDNGDNVCCKGTSGPDAHGKYFGAGAVTAGSFVATKLK